MKGTKAFVANKLDKSVSVVDTNTGALLATIKVAGSPTAVAVSPVADRAYVAMSGTNSVAVIDTVAHKVIDINTATSTVDNIKVGVGPSAIVVSPDGKRVYVSNGSSNTASAIDTATNKEVAKVTVGSSPTGMAVSPDNSRLYALSSSADTLTVVNTVTGAKIGSVNVGDSPRGIVLSANGQRAYVTNYNTDQVAVVNTTGTNPVVIARITVGDKPDGIAMSSDGRLVYVANGPDTVSLINTATNTLTGSAVVIDTTPATATHSIAFTADGKAYVTDYADDVVRVVSLKHYNAAPVSTGVPTMDPPNTTTGAVSGRFHVEDPDKDPLTYSDSHRTDQGIGDIRRGRLTASPIRRPLPPAVKPPKHLGSPILSPSASTTPAGASKNVTVTVSIDPKPLAPNHSPSASPTGWGSASDLATGLVIGQMNGTDPDGDPLTYSVWDVSRRGTTTVNAATGEFTYIPTLSARLQANTTAGYDLDGINGGG